METKTVKAYGTESAETPLHRLDIQRRSLLPNDVEIDFILWNLSLRPSFCA